MPTKKITKKDMNIPVTFLVTLNSNRKLKNEEKNNLIQFIGYRIHGLHCEPPRWADGILSDTMTINAMKITKKG